MSHRLQRVTAFAAALAVALPMSVFAENRSRARTDLEKLAADLERILGPGSARVERAGGERPREVAPPRDLPRATAHDYSAHAVVEAMNRERAAHGLGPLRLDERLSAAAGDRVDDMLAKRYFDHVSPEGIDPFSWVRRRGYRYRIVGENLALGYRSGGSVVDGWMRSPGHRENILQRSFNEVGIAIADRSPARGYRGPLVVAFYASR